MKHSHWHILFLCNPIACRAWSHAAAFGQILPTASKQSDGTLSRGDVRTKYDGRRYHRSHRLWMSKETDDETITSESTTTSTESSSTTTTTTIEQTQKLTPAKALSLLSTFQSMAFPYYTESSSGRRLFLIMIVLTLMNSGVSVAFSYISKDFWNALSSKDVGEFYTMMIKFGGALVVGAPVAVLYR